MSSFVGFFGLVALWYLAMGGKAFKTLARPMSYEGMEHAEILTLSMVSTYYTP